MQQEAIHIGTMDLEMTSRAILKPCAAQVVEGGGLTCQNSICKCVAFKAKETDLVSDEHFRIDGTMGLVTSHAAFQSHGRMLKRKGAALIRVTLGTGILVSKRKFCHLRHQPAVGLVAIDAMNGAFVQTMAKWLEKGSLNLLMARGTDLVRFSHQEMHFLFGVVNRMAFRARQVRFTVQAGWTTCMGGAVGMTA